MNADPCKVVICAFVLTIGTFFFGNPALGNTAEPPDNTSGTIIKALRHEDNAVRTKAIETLRKIHPTTPEIVSALLQLLQNKLENGAIRQAALSAIWSIAEPKAGLNEKFLAPAVPVLVEILEDRKESDSLRSRAASSLGEIEHVTPEVVFTLTKVIKDTREKKPMRVSAAMALAAKGPAAKEAVPNLVDIAHDVKSDEVRERLWSAIALIAPDNKEAIQALIKIAGAEGAANNRLRSNAISTLGKIKAVEAIPTFVHALDDPHPEVQAFGALALSKLGPAAKSTIPAIIESLRSMRTMKDREAPSLRILFINVLLEIDPTSEQVILTIQDIAANDPEPKIREYAHQVL